MPGNKPTLRGTEHQRHAIQFFSTCALAVTSRAHLLNRLLEQRSDFFLIFRKLKFENPTSVASFDLQIAAPESRVLLYHNVNPGTDQENL